KIVSTPIRSIASRSTGASPAYAYSVDNRAMMARLPRLLTAAALAGAFVFAAGGNPAAASRPPRLQYQITTLPNGLTVVLSEDHSTPIVHVNLTYHVG